MSRVINTMSRKIREVVPSFTHEEAYSFTPTISPEAFPYILSSVVSLDGVVEPPRPIQKYYINASDGSMQIYQGAYIYPYPVKGGEGSNTMYGHVEVVFDEVPLPHESVLKWCCLALKAGPISSQARANQLVVVHGNHLHYLWRVLSVEAEATLPDTRSLDISTLHLWRWRPTEGGCGRWVCGRVSIDVHPPDYTITTSRGTRLMDWAGATSFVPDDEPIHKLYMALLGENLL